MGYRSAEELSELFVVPLMGHLYKAIGRFPFQGVYIMGNVLQQKNQQLFTGRIVLGIDGLVGFRVIGCNHTVQLLDFVRMHVLKNQLFLLEEEIIFL